MATGQYTPPVELALGRPATRTLSRKLLIPMRQFAARKPLGAFGGVIVFIFVLLALGAPLVVPFDPNEAALGPSYGPMTGRHLLGNGRARPRHLQPPIGRGQNLFVRGVLCPGVGHQRG